MSSWLHRVTKRYQSSEDPTLSEQSEWIQNPELPDGCETWDDVVVDGDAVRPLNAEELAVRTAVRLVAAKNEKIAAIDGKTGLLLVSGLAVADGKVISTSIAATQNLQDLAIGNALPGVIAFPQAVSTIDGGVYIITDAADLVRIAVLLRDFKFATLGAGRQLRARVLAATTLAEVAAVVDERI